MPHILDMVDVPCEIKEHLVWRPFATLLYKFYWEKLCCHKNHIEVSRLGTFSVVHEYLFLSLNFSKESYDLFSKA